MLFKGEFWTWTRTGVTKPLGCSPSLAHFQPHVLELLSLAQVRVTKLNKILIPNNDYMPHNGLKIQPIQY